MNNLDDKIRYTSSIRLLLEEYMKNYTPQVIRNLSNDMFDLYIAKKGAIDDLLNMLEDPNLDIDGFRNRIEKKLNITIKNAKSSSETSEKMIHDGKIELYKKVLEI